MVGLRECKGQSIDRSRTDGEAFGELGLWPEATSARNVLSVFTLLNFSD